MSHKNSKEFLSFVEYVSILLGESLNKVAKWSLISGISNFNNIYYGFTTYTNNINVVIEFAWNSNYYKLTPIGESIKQETRVEQAGITFYSTKTPLKFDNDGTTKEFSDLDLDSSLTAALTGTGDSFEIFATISDIITSFCKKYSPDILWFTGKRDESTSIKKHNIPLVTTKNSRTKLYDRLIASVGNKIEGYYALLPKINVQGNYVYYQIVNIKFGKKYEEYKK
jgi:hypothetical protein